jgi:hypothetical protein
MLEDKKTVHILIILCPMVVSYWALCEYKKNIKGCVSLLGLFIIELNVDAQHGLAFVPITCISADWVFCKIMEAGSI